MTFTKDGIWEETAHPHVFRFAWAVRLLLLYGDGDVAMNIYECECGAQRTEFIK